jgi:hypothetical protein
LSAHQESDYNNLMSHLPSGGGGGIRTHVRQKGESGFQDRHHKPLGHPSGLKNSTSKRPLQAILLTMRWRLYQTLNNMGDIRAGGPGITDDKGACHEGTTLQ